MLTSPMETSLFLAYRKTPSSEKKGLQTNSTGTCLFSGKDWDHPKQAPSPTHSGIGSQMPICGKSGCKCCRKLTKAGLEIPKETEVQAPGVSQRDEDPTIALAPDKAPCSHHHSAGTSPERASEGRTWHLSHQLGRASSLKCQGLSHTLECGFSAGKTAFIAYMKPHPFAI